MTERKNLLVQTGGEKTFANNVFLNLYVGIIAEVLGILEFTAGFRCCSRSVGEKELQCVISYPNGRFTILERRKPPAHEIPIVDLRFCETMK